MNIYEKIHAIMNSVQKLKKDDTVKFKSIEYKALSEEKVTEIMRQELIKHKLVVFPTSQQWCRHGDISHVDVIYKMVNVENPEEYILIASCGDGADTQDKGSGKAMTYAFKYMWLRTFALPTGEDPDKIASAELDAKSTNYHADEKPVLTTNNNPGDYRLDFGKHAGESFDELMQYEDGRQYVAWLAEECKKPNIRKMAQYVCDLYFSGLVNES